jgi:hypothetical protein
MDAADEIHFLFKTYNANEIMKKTIPYKVPGGIRSNTPRTFEEFGLALLPKNIGKVSLHLQDGSVKKAVPFIKGQLKTGNNNSTVQDWLRSIIEGLD